MSTPTSFKFAVWAPDSTEAGASERRFSFREEHVAKMGHLISQGTLKLGGGMLTDETYLSAEPTIAGSLVILEAATVDEVWKTIKEDIYYTQDVWDKDRLQVTPFLAAIGL